MKNKGKNKLINVYSPKQQQQQHNKLYGKEMLISEKCSLLGYQKSDVNLAIFCMLKTRGNYNQKVFYFFSHHE